MLFTILIEQLSSSTSSYKENGISIYIYRMNSAGWEPMITPLLSGPFIFRFLRPPLLSVLIVMEKCHIIICLAFLDLNRKYTLGIKHNVDFSAY